MELKRKVVHIGSLVFSLLTGHLPWWGMTLCCLGALFFNLFILPRLSRGGLERVEDKQRGFAIGILIYPSVLALLYSFFPRDPLIPLLAWCAMALGDGFGGLVGKLWGKSKLPWNLQKSWFGFFAFVILGGSSTCLWLLCFPHLIKSVWDFAPLIFLSFLVVGWVETLPGLVDDNIAVPVSCALLWWLFLYVPLPPALILPPHFNLAILIVLALSFGSFLAKKMDLPGALVGGLIALALYWGFGLTGLIPLFLFFVGGVAASSLGAKKKRDLGLEQENRGKRSVRHALANGGVAGLCGLLGWLFPDLRLWCFYAAFSSLGAALADTWSSEIGVLFGKKFVNVITLRSEARGQDGAISLEGSIAAFGGGLAMAVCAIPIFGPVSFWLILIAAFGSWLDSVLGYGLQRTNFLTNDTVNFLNTACCAVIGFKAASVLI